jgi:hypothetical protein
VEDRIVIFDKDGHFCPIDEAQIVTVSAYFDIVEQVVNFDGKMGFQASFVKDGELWLKFRDGGYQVINPDPNIQTVFFANDEMQKVAKNYGILEAEVVICIETLTTMLEKAKLSNAGMIQNN